MRILSILFIIVTLHLLADIKDNYCVDKYKVEANIFKKDIKNNFTILQLPKNRVSYSVPSIKIIKKFKEHNIKIKDNSKGIVKFKLNCNQQQKYKKEISLIKKRFIQKYKDNIEIKDIVLNSNRVLKIDGYELEDIIITDSNFRHNRGTLLAIYKKNNIEKRIYLKYNIDGYIYVLQATRNLPKDYIIKDSDYKMIKIRFKKIPSHTIIGDLQKIYITKNRIREGNILTYNHFKIKKEFLKGSYIKAVLKDGALILEMDAKVLQDANIGEIIKIKTASGKIFKAKILPNKIAMILE